IKADLEVGWRRGKPVDLEHYLKAFPELGPADALPAPLVYEEYRVRQRFGDRAPLASYQARFPGQHEELQRLLREQPFPTVTPGVATSPLRGSACPTVKTPALHPQAPL